MTTVKQKKAAKKNIRKARQKWKSLSSQARSRRQPQGRSRRKAGTKGNGEYYRVVVRSKSEFTSFRTHDVGRSGHIQRLAGHRKSGSWATQAWLIPKSGAQKVNGRLVPKDDRVKSVLQKLRGSVQHVKGDIFKALPRRNVPEKNKPTRAQRRARKRNIKKAQKARHRHK